MYIFNTSLKSYIGITLVIDIIWKKWLDIKEGKNKTSCKLVTINFLVEVLDGSKESNILDYFFGNFVLQEVLWMPTYVQKF